jgi:hypothetical protein
MSFNNVPVSLFKNSTLEEITLQQCSLDQAGSRALGQMLKKPDAHITNRLRRSAWNGWTCSIMSALAEGIKSLRKLTLNYGLRWSEAWGVFCLRLPP